MLDFIETNCLLDLAVEDDIASLVFLVRTHFHQHKIANDGVMNLGVIKFLVVMINRLGIDTFA